MLGIPRILGGYEMSNTRFLGSTDEEFKKEVHYV